MNRRKLIEAINSSKLDYNDLYDNIVVIKKDESNFDRESYNEIMYLQMYMYHLKYGICTLSKNRIIPELFPKDIPYEQFKIELKKYIDIKYNNKDLPGFSNLFQEILRLTDFKILHREDWTKIYSSLVSDEEVKEVGKLYVSVDNSCLYQFACLLLVKCLDAGIYDYEFKVNNNEKINRTDNMVIYFTKENLSIYLSIIDELKQVFPNLKLNYAHILGKEISDGVVIANDYKDGSSFTEKVCRIILEYRKKGYDAEYIVNLIESALDVHLEKVVSLVSGEQFGLNH